MQGIFPCHFISLEHVSFKNSNVMWISDTCKRKASDNNSIEGWRWKLRQSLQSHPNLGGGAMV
jgi:hypothetical protein